MASPNVWSGPLATAGPAFASLGGVFLNGTLRFVDSINGNDANSGLTPGSPKKTYSATVTASSANDVILLAPNFTETTSATITIAVANLTTIACGSGASQPQIALGANPGILLNAANARLYGINFTTGNTGVKVQSVSTNAIIDACSFTASTAGEYCISVTGGSGLQVRNTTFNSTQGASAILTNTCVNAVLTGLTLTGTWSSYAIDIGTAAPTGLDVRDVALYNRAGFRISTTGGTYSIFGLRAGDSTPCPIIIAA